MKALSIKQPFVSWIETGLKTFEIRSWRTRYRGPVVLCSSKLPECSPSKVTGELGSTICLAEIEDVHPFLPEHAEDAMAPWRPGMYAWKIKVISTIPRISIKGRLGLFNLEYPYEKLP